MIWRNHTTPRIQSFVCLYLIPIIILTPIFVFAREETILRDDFNDTEYSHKVWEMDEDGTGTVTIIGGHAFLNMTNETKANRFSDSNIHAPGLPYKYAVFEVKLRLSNIGNNREAD